MKFMKHYDTNEEKRQAIEELKDKINKYLESDIACTEDMEHGDVLLSLKGTPYRFFFSRFDVFFACDVIYVKADLENVRFNDEMKSIEFMQPDGEGGVHYALDLYTLKQNIYGKVYKCI